MPLTTYSPANDFVVVTNEDQAELAKISAANLTNRVIQVAGSALTKGAPAVDGTITISLDDTAFAPASTTAIANAAAPQTTVVGSGTGLTGGGDLSSNRTIALSLATQASLALADTALQPGEPSGDIFGSLNTLT